MVKVCWSQFGEVFEWVREAPDMEPAVQRWRRRYEHLLALDVRILARRRRLAPGKNFSWQWSRGGETAGNIGIQAASDHLRLAGRSAGAARLPTACAMNKSHDHK